METAALFMNAKKHNKQAVCILTVSDLFFNPEKLEVKERQTAFADAFLLALDVADEFIKIKKQQNPNYNEKR